MSVTFAIGNSNFGALSPTQGRKAKFLKLGAEHHVQVRFHPFGTAGNYIVRGGRDGMPIVAGVRYVGPLSGNSLDPNVMYRADCQTWANAAATIVDESGTSYASCNIVSGDRVNNPTPIGRGTNMCCFDVVYTFTWDA